MTKYSKMSDFEINKAVSAWKYRDCIELEIYKEGETSDRVVIVSQGIAIDMFDFNNPSDAWPIIEEIWDELLSDCYIHPDDAYPTGTIWEDMCKEHSKLRAAMIVYLMMQEQTND